MTDGDSVQIGPFGGAGCLQEALELEWTQPGPDMLREILTNLRQMD